MAKSIYRDKAFQPDDGMIALSLKETKTLWDSLIKDIFGIYPNVLQEWKYYGAAWGWSLVLKSKAKTLCYLTPADGCFQVSIIFNEKGRVLAAGVGLPENVVQGVEASKDNPKNIPYDFDVIAETNMEIAKKLIAVRSKT